MTDEQRRAKYHGRLTIPAVTEEARRHNRAVLAEALRSGDYPQATGHLRTSYGFCCLGVACDISGLGEWDHYEYRDSASLWSSTTALPSQSIREVYGLTPHGRFEGSGDMRSDNLSSRNDRGVPFVDIANILTDPRIIFKEIDPAPEDEG